MFSFFATIFSLVWIQQHLPLVIGIVAAIFVLFVFLIRRHRKRIRAYLALPIMFIGNKATRIYHCADCPQLARSIPQNRVFFRLRQESERLGYSPCQICHPRWPY